MKNLSGKPYLKGNPKRKILGLAVVRVVSYNNSSLILVSGRVAQLSQGVGSPPWTVALPTYLRFIHVPHWHLVVAVSILRHGCLHIRPGSLHFEAWMPPALSRNTPFRHPLGWRVPGRGCPGRGGGSGALGSRGLGVGVWEQLVAVSGGSLPVLWGIVGL